jgi:hypothetical protein
MGRSAEAPKHWSGWAGAGLAGRARAEGPGPERQPSPAGRRRSPLPLQTVESHIWMGKVLDDLKQVVALLVPLPSNMSVTLGAM